MHTPLAIVLPSYDEMGNLPPLLRDIQAATVMPVDVIVVEDGSDESAALAKSAADELGDDRFKVHLNHRHADAQWGRLSGAVMDGINHAALLDCDWAMVMDSDRQHPVDVIRAIHALASSGRYDLVVATRRIRGGDSGGLSRLRDFGSRALSQLTRMLFPRLMRGLSDPMSGMFAVRLDSIDLADRSGHGFKVLVHLIVRNRLERIAEVPMVFGDRTVGESRAGLAEIKRYLQLLWQLRFPSTTT